MAQSILVVSHQVELAAKLDAALQAGGAGPLEVEHAPSRILASQIVQSKGASIAGVVVDLSDKGDPVALIRLLQAGEHVPPIYAAALDGVAAADAQGAIGAGARRIFQRVEDFPKLLAEQRTLSKLASKRAKLILFAPAQDGAGASTAALHTAGYLANELKARTLLAEIDYFSDSVAYRLRLAETRSLSDLAPGQDWRAAITEWNGLHLLAAPTSTRALRTRGLPEVARVIGESCQEYEFVVGDLPCNTTVVSRDLLSWTDRLYVVATAELTSLYLARRRVHSLVTTGAKMESIRLIVNRDRPGAVETDLAEQVTGLKPSHRLPNDFAAASAAETDAALAPCNSALGRAYTALAADVYGKPAKAAPSNARGWGRLLAALR